MYVLYFFIPESPRWLLSKNRVEEAESIIVKMARWNKKEINEDVLHQQLIQPEVQHAGTNFNCKNFALIRNFNLRWKFIVMIFLGFASDQLFYSLPYTLEKLQGNIFIAFGLQAVVEIPATFLNLFLLNRFGRILPLSGSLLLTSIFCLLTWPTSYANEWGPVCCVIVGKLFITQAVAIIHQLETELYPTLLRGTGIGIHYTVTAISLVISQYIIYTNNVWNVLPLIVMAGLNMVASFVCLFLPETCGKSLPDTVEDAEQIGSVGWDSFFSHFQCLHKVLPVCPHLKLYRVVCSSKLNQYVV